VLHAVCALLNTVYVKQVLVSPFSTCVTLGKLFTFSVPQLPHLQNKHNKSTYLKELFEN